MALKEFWEDLLVAFGDRNTDRSCRNEVDSDFEYQEPSIKNRVSRTEYQILSIQYRFFNQVCSYQAIESFAVYSVVDPSRSCDNALFDAKTLLGL